MISSLLEDLRIQAEKKDHVIYNILFRNAGVGVQYFSKERAGDLPEEPESGDIDDLARWSRQRADHTKRGLVVYGYEKDLQSAMETEIQRMMEL